jgi:hypothetical protein
MREPRVGLCMLLPLSARGVVLAGINVLGVWKTANKTFERRDRRPTKVGDEREGTNVVPKSQGVEETTGTASTGRVPEALGRGAQRRRVL